VKAFLLAAGLGTRLRPLTDTVPKCMLTLDGRPMLDIWLDAFDGAGVDEVLVNLHYLPEVVRAHLAVRTGPPAVRTFFEPELLGSAGTLRAHQEWVARDDFFLACYADNLTDFDLHVLVDAHTARNPVATWSVFHSEHPEAGGVVELAADGRVIGFAEKPREPASDLTNAGMYAFKPAVLADIPDKLPSDIGHDLLPRLVGQAYAVPVEGYFRDIGTAEAYDRARKEWPVRAAT
jgi:mannose-1-phosphate guanylyltransferase